MRFKDKVGVVTGGAGGIGKEVVYGLLKGGAKAAVIFDFREDDLKAAVADLESRGVKAVGMLVDVTQSKQVREAVEQVREQFGPIDILAANAGWGPTRPFLETLEESWDKQIALNIKHHLICAQAVLPDMIKRKSGKIINTASGAAFGAAPGLVVYSACKAAVVSLTRVLAAEFGCYNININCVSPGTIDTPHMRLGFKNNPEALEQSIAHNPMRRLGKPSELAAAILFLASDEASYINGDTICVSGGPTR